MTESMIYRVTKVFVEKTRLHPQVSIHGAATHQTSQAQPKTLKSQIQMAELYARLK